MNLIFRQFLLLLLFGTSTLLAGEYIWFEGESATLNPLHATISTVDKSQYLSNDKWLNLNIPSKEVARKVPAEGARLGYDFEVITAGNYEVWNRIGLSSIRSAFDWRVDNEEWQTIPVEAPYTDLMDVGFWKELAWVKLGTAKLSSGKHSLQIRVLPAMGEKKEKDHTTGKEVVTTEPMPVIYVADCFCLSLGTFRPHGKYKPDAEWRTEDDKKAAAQVFEVNGQGGNGERTLTSLAGLWEVSRWDEFEPMDRTAPDKVLPDSAELFWSAITVPGDKSKSRPDLDFAHRLIYRTHVKVSESGRSYLLHFPANNMITGVIVNGQFCGGATTLLVPWDCDVTSAIKPGGINEIAVVIKDAYYAFTPERANFSKCAYTPYEGVMCHWNNYVGRLMDFPVASNAESGILATPELIGWASVHTSGVFAKSSVKRKELSLDVTVENGKVQDVQATVSVEIVPVGGDTVEKRFQAKEITLHAKQNAVINLTESWGNPRLWWPDDPQQYRAVVTISVDGEPVDVQRTKFGFREWEWAGNQIKLNGVPWHGHGDATEGKSLGETLDIWRQHHQNMTTLTIAGPPIGTDFDAILDAYDKAGIVVKFADLFTNDARVYHHFEHMDPTFFARWSDHLVEWVNAYRNHPSVLAWSIANGVASSDDFANSKRKIDVVLGDAAKRVMEVDPTRPVMVDGGRCLTTEELSINGCEFEETNWRDYPDEAYTLERAFQSKKFPGRLLADRPIFMAKGFFDKQMNNPLSFSQFGGDICGVSWPYAREGAGRFARMLSEGYRWYGVSAFQFVNKENQISDFYNSWSPVCVLCREWNFTFAGGSTVERSLRLLNDTHLSEPIELTWKLSIDGKAVAGEQKSYSVSPGGAQEIKVAFSLPKVQKRTHGEFLLTCNRAGKELFRDKKEVSIIDPESGSKPGLKAGELVVIDPRGSVKTRLIKRGIEFIDLKLADPIPALAKVVVVGPDALDVQTATDPKWKDLAAHGVRVFVLDQEHPLQLAGLPVNMEINSGSGRIAFPETLQHPGLIGLDQPDFYTWSGDHLVYKNCYKKVPHGVKSLIQCDQYLDYTCLVECPTDNGLMVLCQLLVGTKLDSDPVAQRLFDNLLSYVATYQPITHNRVAHTFASDDPRSRLLSDTGVKAEKIENSLASIRSGTAQIHILDATPGELKTLADNLDTVHNYLKKGGWLVLWGVTPEGLKSYNKLVGVKHMIRPFTCERVMLAENRDPLTLGITQQDLIFKAANETNYQARYIPPAEYLADLFSSIVDLEDVAPFMQVDWKKFNPGKDAPVADHDPHNLVNGLFSFESWRYIFQIPIQPELLEWDMSLPQDEVLTEFSVMPNISYKRITGIAMTFDKGAKRPVNFKIQPDNTIQTFSLPDCHAKKIHFKITSWKESATSDLVGIDNLWFKAKRSPDYFQKVKPLLNIGGLVKYPYGKGGIILCQVNVNAQEKFPENYKKKSKIVSTVLGNL